MSHPIPTELGKRASLFGKGSSYFHSQIFPVQLSCMSVSYSCMPTILFKRANFADCVIWIDAARVAPPLLEGKPTATPFAITVSPSIVLKTLVTSPMKTPFTPIVPTLVETTKASFPSSLPVPCAVTSIFPSGRTLHPEFLPLNSATSSPNINLSPLEEEMGKFLISICDCAISATRFCIFRGADRILISL